MWSLPPESGFYAWLCKAFGACLCRSPILESDCLALAKTLPGFAPNSWQGAKKNQSSYNSCLCCNQSMCTDFIDSLPAACAAPPLSFDSSDVFPPPLPSAYPNYPVYLCGTVDGKTCQGSVLSIKENGTTIWMWSYVGTGGMLNQMWSITPIPNSNAFSIISNDGNHALGLSGPLVPQGTPLVLVPVQEAILTPWYAETDGTTFSFFLVDAFQVRYTMSFADTNSGTLLMATTNPINTKFIATSTPNISPSPSSQPNIPAYPVYICGTLDGLTCSNSLVSI